MGTGKRLKILGGKGSKNKGNGPNKKNDNQGSGDPPAASASSGAAPTPDSKINEAIAQKTALAAKAQAEEAAAKETFFRKLLERIGQLLKALAQFFFKRDYPIAHYVALVLVIIFLIYGFSFLFVRSRKRQDKKKKGFWDRIFGYRFSNAFQRVSGVKPVTDPRPTTVGRCDNIDFIEKRMGNGGVCVSDKLPKDLEWIIDSDKIPELKELPQSIKDKLSNDGTRFKVTIPWKAEGLVYVPDCGKAVFADGTPAYLLVDAGNICRKFELDKQINTSKLRYNPNYSKGIGKGLDEFITNVNSSTVQDEKSAGVVDKVSAGEVCSIQAAKDLGIFDKTTFYKVGYDTLRSYNSDFDKNNALTHKLCSENMLRDEASVLCPLLKNAGIGFTAKPGNKCVTAECPPGFTEDKTDPMSCIKPIKEKVVQISSRNDEQYDDWYTIPNYHLGNKYGSSNNVHYAPCPSGSVPYYNSDPVDDSMAEANSKDQIGVCVDKGLFMGGKYAGTANYCPVSMIKRVGSTRNELMEYYKELANKTDVPESVKQKINQLVEGIKTDDFANLNLLSEEMEMACNKLNQDNAKLEEAYIICEQLYKNEDGFVAKFAGEPDSLVKLRRDAAKYSCQQLFGVPPQERSNPNAVNQNAIRIEKPTLNFPGVDQIQFEQYIQEYDNEVREKEQELPVISAEEEKKVFVDMFKSKTWASVIWLSILILIIYTIYYYRRNIGNFINCQVLNRLIWFINLFKTVTIIPRECLSAQEMQKLKTEEIKTKIEAITVEKEEAKLEKPPEPEKPAAPAAPVAPVAPTAPPAQPGKPVKK